QLLGALAEASEVQIADQTVSEVGHGDSPGWGQGNPAPTAGKRKPTTRQNVARSAPQNAHDLHNLPRPPAAKPLRPMGIHHALTTGGAQRGDANGRSCHITSDEGKRGYNFKWQVAEPIGRFSQQPREGLSMAQVTLWKELMNI